MGLGEAALKELRTLLGAQDRPRPRLSGVITVGPSSEVGRLTFVGAVTAEELRGVVDLTVSTNGQFLYSAAFIPGVVGVYARDPISGQLSPVQFVENDSDLKGTISIRLSPDQRYAIAAAFRSKTVVLFKRDPESGRLEQLHVVRSQDGVQGLSFPVRARFSLDGQHVYALEGARCGGISAFKFTPGEGLQWLQTFTNKNTGSSRALAMLPDGNSIVTVNSSSHTLTVFDRAPASGRLSLRQALSDMDAGVSQVEGQFGVTATMDGKFLYVCSGRFSGDNAVSVFHLNNEQKLVPIQAFMNGEDGLTFVGGNEVIVAPDGLNAYATATISGTLACFARDPQTGRLRLIQSIVDDKQTVHLEGPAGLECSPDGRFVYVPLEWQKGIAIYRRELAHSGNY
jgi:6-phosphogluconolactonase (cycloisomerase 2 family)